MTREQIEAALERHGIAKSDAYRDEAFKANPKGYSVSPGCNEPDEDFLQGHASLSPMLIEAVEVIQDLMSARYWVDEATVPSDGDMTAEQIVWNASIANPRIVQARAFLQKFRKEVGG